MCSIRWPTSVTAQLTVSRHNLLCHGTTYFVTAQLTFSRHNLLSRGTIYFLHSTIYFFTAQLTFSPQNYFFIANITFLLVAAQFTFSRYNLLSHGGSQFSRRKCRELGQKNPIPTRPGSPPKSFSFSIMASDNEDVV